MYHGSLCIPSAADTSKINRSQFGVENSSASVATVWCGGAATYLATVTRVDIGVYDRSTPANVSCTVLGLDFGGGVLWSSVLSSSGNSGPVQGLVTFPGQAASSVAISCSLPAITASGMSHVVNYRIVTSP
jgi:hypothetical protein